MANDAPNPVLICERRLKRMMDGSSSDVVARVWQPLQITDGAFAGEYACKYEIEGLPELYSGDAIGIDTMQALISALMGIYSGLRPFQKELTQYADADDGEIGMPVVTYGSDFDGHRRLEAAVEREHRAITDDLAKKAKGST